MKRNLICLLALMCPALSISSARADDEEEDRVSAVIELQDGDVASLKQTGYIKMAIPQELINRVDSVTLKRPGRFKDQAVILYGDVDRRSGMISVCTDDATMEQIDYQPVELKIFESGFSSIVVQYQPGNSTPPKMASKKDSVLFITNLANSKSLTGRLADMKEFTIKSALGEIEVVLEKVSQITFKDDDRATVLMDNGDEISGKIDFRNITINSRWGLEDLKVSDIVSISKPITDFVAGPSVSVMPQHMPIAVGSMPMSVPQHMPLPQHIPIGQGYDPFTGQQVFDHAVDQLMQPMEMTPLDQNFGPFFGGSIPIDGFGEMIQHQQEIPSGQITTPDARNDFWFFPR